MYAAQLNQSTPFGGPVLPDGWEGNNITFPIQILHSDFSCRILPSKCKTKIICDYLIDVSLLFENLLCLSIFSH